MPELLKRKRAARQGYRALESRTRLQHAPAPLSGPLHLPHLSQRRWHMVLVSDLLWAPPHMWLQATRPYWRYTGPRSTLAVIDTIWWLEVCKNG